MGRDLAQAKVGSFLVNGPPRFLSIAAWAGPRDRSAPTADKSTAKINASGSWNWPPEPEAQKRW